MKNNNESNIINQKNNNQETTVPEIDFNLFNEDVIKEINTARENPQQYINKLEEIKKSLPSKSEKYLYIDNIPFIYQNLYSSIENAITFLRSQKKLNKLIENKQLSLCCQELKENLIINNCDKNIDTKFEERCNKYGKAFGENYEIISYNLFDPEFIVINLILGDNDSTKFGRKILFNPDIKYIGLDSHFDNINIFCIIKFCEDFYEKGKNPTDEINDKYKNKETTYANKIIVNEIRNYYLDKNDDMNLNNKIDNMLINIKKTKKHKHKKKNYTINNDINKENNINTNTYIPLRGKHKKIDLDENNLKLKNDVYYNYHAFNNLDLDNFDEDEFFEKEFDKTWGKNEKDKNFQKKLYTSTTTSKNGLNTTIITEIYENVKNGIKKGYYIEKEKFKNLNFNNENSEKEKRDLAILKEMEKKENERKKNLNKKENKSDNEGLNILDYFDNDEGIVDIKINKEEKIDSKGRNVVDITKNLFYDNGKVRNVTVRKKLDSNKDE